MYLPTIGVAALALQLFSTFAVAQDVKLDVAIRSAGRASIGDCIWSATNDGRINAGQTSSKNRGIRSICRNTIDWNPLCSLATAPKNWQMTDCVGRMDLYYRRGQVMTLPKTIKNSKGECTYLAYGSNAAGGIDRNRNCFCDEVNKTSFRCL